MPHRPIRAVIEGRPLHAAPSGTTVQEAARLMAERRIGALLVVDGGRLVGIFSERDALNRVLARALDPATTPLACVMTPDPHTVAIDKPLAFALHVMHAEGFRHMPVTDGGRPVGMVSVRDALGLEIAAFERDLAQRDHLTERLG